MYGLDGKVAIVTGAAGQRGMGRVHALRLAREGASVVVVDLPEPIQWLPEDQVDKQWRGIHSVVAEIERLGGKALAVTADVSDWSQVDAMAERALERFGSIDILVNNAAANQQPVPIVDMDETVWDKLMAVNAKGVFLGCKRVAKEMIRQGGGSIINTASRLGKLGLANMGAYCASKFVVVAITQVLAQEVAPHGVRVNAVCPGWVATDMTAELVGRGAAEEMGVSVEEAQQTLSEKVIPLKRMAAPEEIASVVAFLASNESSYMTGQSINVTGGRWMH